MTTDATASTLSSPAPQLGFLDPTTTVGYFGIQPGMKVAEFGVGRGYYALALARLVGPGGVMTGIDVVGTTLDILAGAAQVEGLENVRLVRADLEVLGGTGLAEGSQDFVLVANILFQSQKKAEIIAEAHRVLHMSGTMVVIDWRKGASGGVGPHDTVRISEDELRQMVTSTGFELLNTIDSGSFHYGFLFRKNS